MNERIDVLRRSVETVRKAAVDGAEHRIIKFISANGGILSASTPERFQLLGNFLEYEIKKEEERIKMAEVIPLNKEATHPTEGELANRISDIIREYEGSISYCSAIGALEIVKAQLLKSSGI